MGPCVQRSFPPGVADHKSIADEPFRVQVKDASSENGQRINRAKRRLARKMANTTTTILRYYTSSSFPESASSFFGPNFTSCIDDASVSRLAFACHYLQKCNKTKTKNEIRWQVYGATGNKRNTNPKFHGSKETK